MFGYQLYRSSWVKNGEAKRKLKGSAIYEDCIVELEWISSDSDTLDSGTLTILNPDGVTTLVSYRNSILNSFHILI